MNFVPAKIDSVKNASLYDKGIFTTIAVFEGTPFLWHKHWRRLASNALKLGIEISDFSEESVLNSLVNALKKSGLEHGRARITFFDESPNEIWGEGSDKKTGLSTVIAGPRKIPDDFKLAVSPHRLNTTSPLAGVKSCNYLEHLMAHDEASNRGFNEAIRLNERGEIASACMANVFWLKCEKLYTPSLKTGCLAGTTREFVLENFECEEVEIGIDVLANADSIFLTSAGLRVVEVGEFEARQLGRLDHPILDLLPKAEPPA